MPQASPAAETMDNLYRRQRFIYDATRRYYLLGRNRLIAELGPPDGGSVLEIGCGTARNLILAARRYPGAEFYGLDVSEAMLRTARASIRRSGVEGRIALAAGDATSFEAVGLFGVQAFDRIFISYTLSMIPAWREVVRQASSLVAPGGALLIVDFGEFACYPAILRRAQRAWLARFSVTPIPDLEAQLKELAGQIGFAATMIGLYGGYAVQARLTACRSDKSDAKTNSLIGASDSG
jgi:S-adenosylmethionine-diacylgycerolhomoserine-N-methlytransferase